MELRLPQATLLRTEQGEKRWLATSPDFPTDWRSLLEPLAVRFGPRPEGVLCPEAIVVQPLGRRQVVVMRAADVGHLDAPPVGLGFHFLVLSQDQYRAIGHDPFLLLASCPSDWHKRGDWTEALVNVMPAPRTVADVVAVIQRPDSAALLGGAQALVDGCKLAWVRTAPADGIVPALWKLLPTAARGELWPATFAFSNALGFDAVVLPRIDKGEFDPRYLSEEQAANYPEGRYELGVQAAAESGDQATLNALFARRSRSEVWRMGWWLLGALIVLTIAAQLLKTVMR